MLVRRILFIYFFEAVEKRGAMCYNGLRDHTEV